MGASKAYITRIVMRETLAMCIVGIVFGYLFAYSAKVAIETFFPLIAVLILPSWVFWGAFIAIVSSLVGSLYPATKAARQDPIEALAYD